MNNNETKKNKSTLVLGGTGHFGQHAVRELLKNGERVCVMTRNPTKAREILGADAGPEIIQGDLLYKESIEKALTDNDVGAILISIASIGWRASRQRMVVDRDAVIQVLAAAERSGISRVVYVSGYDVQEEFVRDLGIEDIARPMLDVQMALKESNLNWTVLGCPPSMELFFSMIRGDTMNVPGGGPPNGIPTISARDVGKIAAQALVRDDLGGHHYRMAGCPEALTFSEAAEVIGDTWNQSIHVRSIPLMPVKVAGLFTRPFSPYVQHIVSLLTLLNSFPKELTDQVPQDHQRLLDTFDFTPTTLVDEALRRMQ